MLKAAANNLLQALTAARFQAISQHTTIKICPSLNHHYCTNNWRGNREIIFRKHNTTYKHISLNNILSSWRANLNNTPAILFLPDGKTAGEQGSISLQAPGYSTSYKITVNRSGNAMLTENY